MKAFKYISLMAAAILMSACTLDIEKASLKNPDELVAPVLNEIGSIIPDSNTSTVEKVVFTWSAVDFGVPTQVQYSLYATMGGEKALIGQSYNNRLTVGKGDLVGVICNDLNAAKNETVNVGAYVEANIYGSDVTEAVASNEITFSIYTFLPPKKNIWLPGKYQGWNQLGTIVWEVAAGSSQYKILVDVSNTEETPYFFKIVDEGQNWVGMNDGYAPDGWTVAAESSDGNFSVPEEEPILWLTIDTKRKTVAKQVISKVALLGDFNTWSEPNELVFTYDATENIWTSPVVSFTEGASWLIRLNKDWTLKYGSAVASGDVPGGFEVTQGGDNIPAPGTGDYIVRLHGNRTPLVIEYVKQ